MKMDLYTPIGAGQNALVQVYGSNELGYVMVKVNGQYRTALPDDNPGVPSQHRLVVCPPAGRGYNVWSDPLWQSHDSVDFELYDSATNTRQAACGTVIL